MRLRRLLPLLVVALPALHAQQREPFTYETLRKVVSVGGLDVSPDGRTAAITVTRPDFATNRNLVSLWIVPIAGGTPRELTPGRTSVSSPQWSPDGATLAFLAPDSAGRAQLWTLPVAGGEARRLTNHPTTIVQYAWRPDGSGIGFTAEDAPPVRTGEERFVNAFEIGAQDVFLRRAVRPVHLWLVDARGGEPRRLTQGTWSVDFVLPPGAPPSGVNWSPDGRTIAFAQRVSAESGKRDSVHVALLDVASGTIRPLTDVRRWERQPLWSPDGRTIAYRQPRDGRGDAGWLDEVYVVPTAGGAARSLTRALDRHILFHEWLPDGSGLLVSGADAATQGAWVQRLDGTTTRLALGELVLTGGFGADIRATSTGGFVFIATRNDRPAELYAMDSPTATPRRLTDFNAWAESIAWGRSERITWRSEKFEADGIVTYPAGFDAARRHPLVLVIHGGPTSSSKLSYSALPQLLAAAGFVVFQPNYRGSDNLGNAFQSAIRFDAGAGPGRDVMAGVRLLRTKPGIDPTRTGVTGWSYGGYMTSWLIGNYPGEWTVAMAGAPVTDWEDMYNLGDSNLAIRHTLGGTPWSGEAIREYRAQSPITYVRNVRTPTLIMSNMEDFRVPPTQALAMYRALQDRGVESRFIGFEGRTHNSADPVNNRERTKLWVEWVKAKLATPVP